MHSALSGGPPIQLQQTPKRRNPSAYFNLAQHVHFKSWRAHSFAAGHLPTWEFQVGVEEDRCIRRCRVAFPSPPLLELVSSAAHAHAPSKLIFRILARRLRSSVRYLLHSVDHTRL